VVTVAIVPKPRFLLMRWSRPITDSSHPGPPDAREVLGLEAAIRYLISQADTDDLPVPDHEPDRSRWWRDLLGDIGVGDSSTPSGGAKGISTQGACRTVRSRARRHCPPGDPELTFVLYMCAYARDIARGELPGPLHRRQRPRLRAPA
jgi:hypothetical protein